MEMSNDDEINLSSYQAAINSNSQLQISSEQIIADALKLNEIDTKKILIRKLTSNQILNDKISEGKRRIKYEDELRRHPNVFRTYIQYANYELMLKELERARSIYERGLVQLPDCIHLWNSYIKFELSLNNVNSARNLFERVIKLLPLEDQFWKNYIALEYKKSNINKCRKLYQNWIAYKPCASIYFDYINFEKENGNIDACLVIIDQLISDHPNIDSYIQAATWFYKQQRYQSARNYYEKASIELPLNMLSSQYFIRYAKFEEKSKNRIAANNIFERGVKIYHKQDRFDLLNEYVKFLKRGNDLNLVYKAILNLKIEFYLEKLNVSENDYEIWYEYLKAKESQISIESDKSMQTDLINEFNNDYMKCLSKYPTNTNKRGLLFYTHIYFFYLVFIELVLKNYNFCQSKFEELADVVPKDSSEYSKYWILWAKFLLRNAGIGAARLKFGEAIGKCGTHEIFKNYINLETKLNEYDRCRKILAKYIELYPNSLESWLTLIELEESINSFNIIENIYNLALSQVNQNESKIIWKKFIDYYIREHKIEHARALFDRYFDICKDIDILYKKIDFELDIGKNICNARETFEKINEYCIANKLNESRAICINKWINFENKHGSAIEKEHVTKLKPELVIKKRLKEKQNSNEIEDEYEEYIDYIFYDQHEDNSIMKLLQAAKEHRKKN